MYTERIRTLLDSIFDNECVYIKNDKNVYYYSGFSGEGFLLISKYHKRLVTDFRYLYDAKTAEKYGYEIYDIKNGIKGAVDKNITALYVEGSDISLKAYNELSEKLECVEIKCEDFLAKNRVVKSDDEISYIKKASEIAECAFEKILKMIDSNVTEKQLAVEFEYLVKKSGASAVSFDTIVASGLNSSMPHAQPTDKKIEKGDFITFDFGCVYNNYCSDMTRTVAYGSASDKMKNVYDIVLEAQLEGLKSVKAGAMCSDADKSARDIIDAAGFKNQFGHALGHGVGLNIHENPRLSPKCDTVLKNNMVVTVEPGIYIEGEFGVRIEDLVVVRDENPYILTKFEKNLVII